MVRIVLHRHGGGSLFLRFDFRSVYCSSHGHCFSIIEERSRLREVWLNRIGGHVPFTSCLHRRLTDEIRSGRVLVRDACWHLLFDEADRWHMDPPIRRFLRIECERKWSEKGYTLPY